MSMLWILLAKFSSCFFFWTLLTQSGLWTFHFLPSAWPERDQRQTSLQDWGRHFVQPEDKRNLKKNEKRKKKRKKKKKRKRVPRSNLNVCLSNTRTAHSCFQSIVPPITSVWLPFFVNKLHRQWCTLGIACLCLVAYHFVCQRGPLKNHQSNDPYWYVWLFVGSLLW